MGRVPFVGQMNGSLWGALAALGGLTGVAAIVVPCRRWWRRGSTVRHEHHLDHAGRPARLDPSTGEVIQEAQPGLAAAMVEVRARTTRIAAIVDEIKTHVSTATDNTDAITEVRDMLRDFRRVNDLRHEQNRADIERTRATAEGSRADVAELRGAVNEAVKQASDAAGHAARIERQQTELQEAVDQRFSEHLLAEQTFVRSLAEFGVQIEWPRPTSTD